MTTVTGTSIKLFLAMALLGASVGSAQATIGRPLGASTGDRSVGKPLSAKQAASLTGEAVRRAQGYISMQKLKGATSSVQLERASVNAFLNISIKDPSGAKIAIAQYKVAGVKTLRPATGGGAAKGSLYKEFVESRAANAGTE